MSEEPTYSVTVFKGHVPVEYEGMVYSHWLRSFRHGNDMIKLIEPSAYYDNYKGVITTIVTNPDTETRIAVLNEDEETSLAAFGFSVSRGTTLHYVYVPHAFRRTGIAMSLLPKNMTTFTHLTKSWLLIWPRDAYKHLKYIPWS